MNVQKALFYGSKTVQPGQKINYFGFKEMTGTRGNFVMNSNKKPFHATAQVKYPPAKNIPLPNNIESIMSIEIGQFSPERARDISGPVIISRTENAFQTNRPVFSKSFNQFLESYDCKGAVSLNSSMQSNVPIPFISKGNVMHLNMPGGQWEQGNKFISEDMQKKMYYLHVNNKKKQGICMFHTMIHKIPNSSSSIILRRFESNKNSLRNKLKLIGETTTRSKFKRALKEYGSTVIVFHVAISLVSLGGCYAAVTSGIDMETVLEYFPRFNDSTAKLTSTVGTFATAYVIHKCLAPIRIAITVTSVPFIVKYLRKVGFLKPR